MENLKSKNIRDFAQIKSGEYSKFASSGHFAQFRMGEYSNFAGSGDFAQIRSPKVRTLWLLIAALITGKDRRKPNAIIDEEGKGIIIS